jgi:hypothetical protein
MNFVGEKLELTLGMLFGIMLASWFAGLCIGLLQAFAQ